MSGVAEVTVLSNMVSAPESVGMLQITLTLVGATVACEVMVSTMDDSATSDGIKIILQAVMENNARLMGWMVYFVAITVMVIGEDTKAYIAQY